MSTSIVGGNVEVIQAGGAGNITGLSWSVAIAGALAATAVTFIFLSLGSGIGLAVASPSGPSAGTLTIAGAIWLVFAQTVGYATGGFIAGRLRIRTHVPGHETHFRDGAHGFMAWVIGVGLTSTLVFMVGAFSATTAANMASSIGAGALRSASLAASSQTGSGANLTPDSMGYFVDALFRTNPTQTGTPPAASPQAPTAAPAQPQAGATTTQPSAGADPAASPAGETPPSMALYGGVPGSRTAGFGDLPRAEASRILFSGVSEGGLSVGDRTYLARLVAARTGIPAEEAERRVTEVQDRAMQRIRETAESARRAGAYLSFWSFMALLFGAVAAVMGGILGGEHRDQI